GAWAQAPSGRDPADLMAQDVPIYVEAKDVKALASLLEHGPILSAPGMDRSFLQTLHDLGGAGARRVALGFSPAVVGAHRWVAIVETEDPDPVVALARTWTSTTISTGRVAGFLLVTNGEKTIASAAELAEGKGRALSSRPDFQAFEKSYGPESPIRFHL